MSETCFSLKPIHPLLMRLMEIENMQSPIQRFPTIGVLAGWQVYEGYVHGFLDLVLHGIYAEAQNQGCNLLLACGLGHTSSPIRLQPAWPVVAPENDFVPVGPWNTDGLIAINPLLTTERSQYIQQVIAEGHPLVFVGPGEKGASVGLDNESGIRQAIKHLVQHGHQRIAFIAGHENNEVDADSLLRLQAYRRAVQDYGLESDPRLIVHGYHDIVRGRQAMQELLDSKVGFTAILASNDHSAIGAMETIRKAGLRIPEDIAIIGFDDWPDAAGQNPPLTSIHYPVVEAGRRALTLLLQIINGQSSADKSIQVPVKLIVRESCGCLPGRLIGKDISTTGEQDQDSIISLPAIARSIREAVRDETRFIKPDELTILSTQLVEAFHHYLKERDPSSFHKVFSGILQQVEEAGDDPYVWHTALSSLEESVPELLIATNDDVRQPVEEMMRQARIAISISIRRQYRQHVHKRRFVADQLGRLTSRLFMVVDENQIFNALAEYLPPIGIRYTLVAIYEAEGNDQVARTRLYSTSESPVVPIHFPSRQFPPAGVFPVNKPFSLVLFPLLIQDVAAGYIAIDTIDLDTSVTIVQQLAGAFRSIRLHKEAVEGQRLAEEANHMKSRFLSTVSHELRTPLSLITGLSHSLIKQPEEVALPSEAGIRDELQRIYISAQQLDGLIQDVLDLSRDEAGELKLTCEPLDLAEVLQPVIMTGQQIAQDKCLSWRCEIPTDLPRVWGDRTRLRQVILNLVNNALKFTAEGEVALIVRLDKRMVTIRVSDTGLGIPPEEQELIFDEFRQSERTTARGYGGLGLGLAICKRLVEMHGGRIWVDSAGQEGAGSSFFFTLPVIQAEADSRAMASPIKGGPVVLLVAKHSRAGKELHDHLADHGYQVVRLQVDEESSNWISPLLNAGPGAIVLDAGLAPRFGWEIIKILKENPSTEDVPVLFFSLQKKRGSILELDYLTKPVDPPELIGALARQGLNVNSSAEGKAILLVDDDTAILEMHARIIESQFPACRVLRAHDGREALEVIRQELPNLILLDLMMPELDGFGVLNALRKDENIRTIPVVVLTGQVLTEEDMARLNQGVAAVLQKGIFSAQETMAHVESALARAPRLGSEMQWIVRKAMAYIHKHYAEPFSRLDMARQLGLSERYLTRCFHKELNITPVEYLNRYRLKEAKAMLGTGANVTETAMAVGFSSVSYFTRLFEKELGVSPGVYRHNHSHR
jgi:signal transduction histidine kinase/DNA-binding LacI/PurR family transcriptional regulator/DNA-binding response OmpR family regulator